MTWIRYSGFLLIATFWITACSIGLHKKASSQSSPALDASPAGQDVIMELTESLNAARQAVEVRQWERADSLFSNLLEKLDAAPAELQSDSALLSLREEIEAAYQEFLNESGFVSADTLESDIVLQELNQLDSTVIFQEGDTSTVSIPDVIDTTHSMRIPLVLNKQVENAIRYFTGRGRRIFEIWLQRSGRYENLIKQILREEGVPEELFYLAMIESGLNPRARSYAGAVGIWQFISSTGKAYGLRHSWWYDERRDPVKATRAAARHLKDLYERFGDWYLAMAGYNFSPRKIEHRLRRYQVSEFWDLPRLPRQTRNYIPTFIAAVTIAKHPADHGFEVEKLPPIEFDTVTVRECVDLNVVAECTGSTFETIKELNPALLRWCTPPDKESWVLNIPRGTRQMFLENYQKVPEEKKLSWVHHRIQFGETLSTIARKYGVSMSEIKRFNKIRGTLIRAGDYLVIPVPQNKKYYQYARTATVKRPKAQPVKNVPGRKKLEYVVKNGDTLWDIALKFGVTITQLRQWNGLGYSRIIRPGQTLNIWLPEEEFAAFENETLLAKKESSDPPEAKPSVPAEGKPRVIFYYTVRRGDTLWDIARQHGVSIRELKKWNDLQGNTIRPGDKLKIYQ